MIWVPQSRLWHTIVSIYVSVLTSHTLAAQALPPRLPFPHLSHPLSSPSHLPPRPSYVPSLYLYINLSLPISLQLHTLTQDRPASCSKRQVKSCRSRHAVGSLPVQAAKGKPATVKRGLPFRHTTSTALLPLLSSAARPSILSRPRTSRQGDIHSGAESVFAFALGRRVSGLMMHSQAGMHELIGFGSQVTTAGVLRAQANCTGLVAEINAQTGGASLPW